MIPVLWRYLGGFLIVVMLVGAIYLKGRTDGANKVQKVLDAQRLEWQEEFDKQVQTTQRIQEGWNAAREQADEIQARLNVVSADGITLAQRLREHSRRSSCTVPAVTGSAIEPEPSGGEPADGDPVGRATEAHFAACARDAERLNGWIAFYEELRRAQ
jgi:hypothetical protein